MYFLHDFLNQDIQVDWIIFFLKGEGGKELSIFNTFSINKLECKFFYGQPISMLISYGNESNLIW